MPDIDNFEQLLEISPPVTASTAAVPDLAYIAKQVAVNSELTSQVIDDLRLQNLIEYYGNFTEQRCCKTGRILGKHSPEYLTMCFQTMPEEYAVELLMRDNIARPAIHWVKDDGDALRKLAVIDPIGYFIYASGYVLAHYSPHGNVKLKYQMIKDPDIRHDAYQEFSQAKWEWIDQKAEAFKLLQGVDLTLLMRINETLRKWNVFFNATLLPEELRTFRALIANRENEDVLIAAAENPERFERLVSQSFSSAIKKFNQKGLIDPTTDYNKLLTFREKFGGHSNFYYQRPSQTGTYTGDLFIMLQGELAKEGINDINLRSMEHKKQTVVHKDRFISISKNETLAHIGTAGMFKRKQKDNQ